MKEIRPARRVTPGYREQLMAFARSVLPPLIARYALRFLRVAAATPAVRAFMLVLVGLAAVFLFVPAMLVGLVAWLATGDGTTATISALVVVAVATVVILVLCARLYSQWKRFRLRYMVK